MKKILVFCLLIQMSINAQKNYSFIYDSQAIIAKGISLHEEEKFAEAIAEYEKIDVNDPEYYTAQYEKILSLSRLKKEEELKIIFDDLYKNKKMDEHPTLYVLYGNFLSDQKDFEQSEKMFVEAEKYLSNSSNCLFNHALKCIRNKENQRAVDLLKKTISINPNYSSAHYFIGLLAYENGKIAEGSLALMTYLGIAPIGNYAVEAIVRLNLNLGQNYLDSNKLVFSQSGDNFEELETILRNQLPLKKAYKIKNEIDDNVTRQVQAIAEYCVDHKIENGFFETMYVPWVKKMMSENQFEGYSYFMLLGLENKLGKKLTSKEKLILSFSEKFIKESFATEITKRNQEHYGKKEDVSILLYQSRPYLIGKLIDGKKQGKFTLLDENGRKTGDLNFIDDKIDGYQRYTDDKGVLSQESNYKEGKLNGKKTNYYENGNLQSIENYIDDELDGDFMSYYAIGGKRCEGFFIKGQRDKKFVCYYQNGNIKTEYEYKNGKLNGAGIEYDEAGNKTLITNFVEGEYDGLYNEFYDGKILKASCEYKNGKPITNFKKFYKNGKLEQENFITNAKIVKSILYSKNGDIVNETLYNENEEAETLKYYDENQQVYGIENFKKGELKSFTQFTKDNPKPQENSLSKSFKLLNYEGTEIAIGQFEKGKKTGKWIHNYQNGTIRSIEEFGKSRGLKNGISEDYDTKGNLERKANYENDTISGLYEVYNNNRLDVLYHYKKGAQLGPFKAYYKDGSLSSDGFLVDGELEANRNYFTIGNKIFYKKHFINNDNDRYETYDQNQQLENSINLSNKNGLVKTIFNRGAYTKEENYNKNGILNGKSITKDKFDTPIKSVEYLNGEYHNEYKTYSPYGTINIEASYVCGKLNGAYKTYDLVGSLRMTDQNILGESFGKLTRYYHTKTKIIECNQVDDDYEGDYFYYNQKEQPILKIFYKSGMPKYYVKLDSKDLLSEKVIINKESAVIESKYANGKTAISLKLVNGNFDGDMIIYSQSAKKEFQVSYKNGMLDGKRIEYYANGNIYKSENFVNNDYEGFQEYYNENGTKKLVAEYKFDLLHGLTTIYENGVPKIEKKYDTNELVEVNKK